MRVEDENQKWHGGGDDRPLKYPAVDFVDQRGILYLLIYAFCVTGLSSYQVVMKRGLT